MLLTMNKWKDMTEDQLCQIEKQALIARKNDEDENINTTCWINSIEEGYFEYSNFEFENGLFRKTKWGTKNKVGN